MHQFKNVILDYYSKMVHDIDLLTEKKLRNSDKELQNEINLLRKNVLEKVKETQEHNLKYLNENKNLFESFKSQDSINHLIFSEKFCFYIEKEDQNEHLILETTPGVLICTNVYVPSTCVLQISEISKKSLSLEDVKEKDFVNFLITYTTIRLIEKQQGRNSIIDLTDSKRNILEDLILKGNFKKPSDDSFQILEKIINIDYLKNIQFGFFDLDTFPRKWFEKFFSIERLAIVGNSVKKLYNDNFSDLKSLKTLEITTSNLEIMEPNVFDGLDKLESFIFRTLRINNLNISKMVLLKKLTIHYSELKVLTNETIIYNDFLEKLKIQNNTLVSIEDDAFKNISDIKEIIIRNNNPKLILRKNAFHGLNDLEILCLTDNGIQEIPNGLFDDLKRLKYLNLRRNLLKSISSQNLNRMENLLILDLNENKDFKLDVESINLPNLKYLQLNCKSVPNLAKLTSLTGFEIGELNEFDENIFNYENNFEYVCLKFLNGDIYNQLNTNNFNGLKNLNYFELRIKNLKDFNTEKAVIKDKTLIEIVNPKTKNSDVSIDYFLSSFLIKTNSGSKKEYLEFILNSSQLNESDILEYFW